jgi:hypothetical protein
VNATLSLGTTDRGKNIAFTSFVSPSPHRQYIRPSVSRGRPEIEREQPNEKTLREEGRETRHLRYTDSEISSDKENRDHYLFQNVKNIRHYKFIIFKIYHIQNLYHEFEKSKYQKLIFVLFIFFYFMNLIRKYVFQIFCENSCK